MKTVGCTTVLTTLTPDYEPGKIHIGQRTIGQHGLFGWSPSVIEKHKRTGKWFVTHTGGGYPLDSHVAPFAVPLESTYTLLVYLKGDYLPVRIYKTLEALVGMERRDVWLIKSQAFTLSQSPVIQTCYLLSEVKPGDFTYVNFEQPDETSVEVFLYEHPERSVPLEEEKP